MGSINYNKLFFALSALTLSGQLTHADITKRRKDGNTEPRIEPWAAGCYAPPCTTDPNRCPPISSTLWWLGQPQNHQRFTTFRLKIFEFERFFKV